MSTVFGLGSVALYLTGAVLLGLRLASLPAFAFLGRRHLVAVAAGGVTLHGVLLYQGIVTERGLDLGFFNALSLIAWVVVLLLVLAALTKPVANLGLIVLPLAALSIVLALAYTTARPPEWASLGIQVHTMVSILAFGVLTIAACQSILLALQERQLRHKPPGRLIQILPPLQTQESVLFQLLGIGFFLLSLGLASGMMFVQDMLAQHLAHKTILATAAWCVFAVLLWGRWRFGWRGRTAIRWCLAGFCILALAYLGSKLVLEVVLGEYWSQG